MPITAADVEAAGTRLRDAGMRPIATHASPRLSESAGCELFCKLEYLHPTGSFKERGALNALLVRRDEIDTGVIAASAGNHALALANHGRALGIAVTVVMPTTAPLVKIATCRSFGAEVVLHGQTFGEARQHANQLVQDRGLVYIHGFDDPAVIAGAGTVGLELLDEVPDLDAIVVPVGGGGLIAGIATIVHERRPTCRVIGVETEAAPTLTAALEADGPINVETRPGIADGLAIPRLGDNAWPACRDHVDHVVQVTESETARAALNLLEVEKALVEGSGATSLAAVMGPLRDELAGKKVAIVLCGGNIDVQVLGRIIERGLAADGRLCRLTCRVSDRAGSLSSLLTTIKQAGASVKEVYHDRSFGPADVGRVDISLVLETHDKTHVAEVHEVLRRAGVDFWVPRVRR
ncbi:MAG: threonine ammonia-lyase [Planctomycetota bacterium]